MTPTPAALPEPLNCAALVRDLREVANEIAAPSTRFVTAIDQFRWHQEQADKLNALATGFVAMNTRAQAPKAGAVAEPVAWLVKFRCGSGHSFRAWRVESNAANWDAHGAMGVILSKPFPVYEHPPTPPASEVRGLVEVLRDLDRLAGLAIQYQSTGPGYIEEMRERIRAALSAPGPVVEVTFDKATRVKPTVDVDTIALDAAKDICAMGLCHSRAQLIAQMQTRIVTALTAALERKDHE